MSGTAAVALAAPLVIAILLGASNSVDAPGVSVIATPTAAEEAPSSPADSADAIPAATSRSVYRDLSARETHVPLSPPGEIEYTVQPGDTLTRIASVFDVPVDALLDANDIPDPDVLATGTRLTVILPLDLDAPHHPALPPVERYLREAERTYGLPHGLLLALAWRESTWDQDAVSPAGAVGIAQVLPSTARWTQDELLETDHDWRGDARENAHMGAAYLRYLLDRADGDVWIALAAYYQGWHAVKAHGPYADTRRYVDDVLGLVSRFQ